MYPEAEFLTKIAHLVEYHLTAQTLDVESSR